MNGKSSHSVKTDTTFCYDAIFSYIKTFVLQTLFCKKIQCINNTWNGNKRNKDKTKGSNSTFYVKFFCSLSHFIKLQFTKYLNNNFIWIQLHWNWFINFTDLSQGLITIPLMSVNDWVLATCVQSQSYPFLVRTLLSNIHHLTMNPQYLGLLGYTVIDSWSTRLKNQNGSFFSKLVWRLT